MTPEDVFRMSDKYANNPTMRRLIADHAGKMADDTKFEGSRGFSAVFFRQTGT